MLNKSKMAKITRLSKNCLALIEHFECGGDFRKFLKAYKCPSGKWKIGMGTTRYPNGERVMPGDVITEHEAFEYLTYDLAAAESTVAHCVTSPINQGQFDALVSFTYNLGALAFQNSTLLKIINKDPAGLGIETQFCRWRLAGGKPYSGLVRWRRAEAHLFIYGELKFGF